MKKKALYILMALFMSLSAFACSSDRDEKYIDVQQLPNAAATLINTYYPSAEVIKVVHKVHGSDKGYEVDFADGTEIDFDQAGQWVKIEAGRNGSVPRGIIPEKIATYIDTHHPRALVTEIDRDRRGYEVELDDNIDIDFDSAGNFVRYDR